MSPNFDSKLTQASQAFNAGQYDKARQKFLQLQRLSPNNPFILNGLGHSIAMLEGYSKGASLFQKAITLKPDYMEALDNLGRAHRDLRNYAEAINCFKRILKKHPKNAMINDQLGLTYVENTGGAKAVPYFKKAIKINPNIASYHYNLGTAQLTLGQLLEAEKSFRNCIAISPENASAYSSIATLKKFIDQNDRDIERMQQLIESSHLSISDKILIHFALGKAFDDLSDFKAAFTHFCYGNNLKASTFKDYSVNKEIDEIKKVIKVVDQQTVSNKSSGTPDNSPIFIIGMPRSGTSLVEQILSSHPLVFGGGELLTLPKTIVTMETAWQVLHPSFLKLKPIRELRQISDVYLEETRKLKGKASFFTDKLPANFKFLGLIAMLMPQAKFINLIRDPMDICLSCYTMNFHPHQEFSFNLETLGTYYNAYADMMTHWNHVLPDGKIYNLHYEKLVNEPENEVRKLLEYCNLNWDENCLNFHQNKRSVATASIAQVRQPLHNKSVQRWRNYEQQLAPLRQIIKNN